MSLQDIAHGIIREYLKLHGYTEAYEAFEREAERRQIPKLFGKRLEMLEAVGITEAFKRELEKKKRGEPHLLTSLEVLLKMYKECTTDSNQTQVKEPPADNAAEHARNVVRRRVKSSKHPSRDSCRTLLQEQAPVITGTNLLLDQPEEQPSFKSSPNIEALIDCEEPFPNVRATPLADFIAQNGSMELLNRLLFGSNKTGKIPDTWYQSLHCKVLDPKARTKETRFSLQRPKTWGISQHEGGPCSIIATMQARMAKYLFYGVEPRVRVSRIFAEVLKIGLPRLKDTGPPIQFVEAVLSSIYETLETISERLAHRAVHIVLPVTYKSLTGSVMHQLAKTASMYEQLQSNLFAIIHNQLGLRYVNELDHFVVLTANSMVEVCAILSTPFYQYYALTSLPSPFIPTLVLSAMLTRTLVGIFREDLDGTDCRTAPFGREVTFEGFFGSMNNASVELTNLFIQGRAVSSLHDNIITSDDFTFNGIDSPSPIGILSIFEYYEYIKIGNNMKWNTLTPCFVVFNEDHYTSIFPKDAATAETLSTAFSRRSFDAKTCVDLIYYDSLDDQSQVVRLTLALEGQVTCKTESHGLKDKSFVNQLLYTLFGDALVSCSWNGTEPYL